VFALHRLISSGYIMPVIVLRVQQDHGASGYTSLLTFTIARDAQLPSLSIADAYSAASPLTALGLIVVDADMHRIARECRRFGVQCVLCVPCVTATRLADSTLWFGVALRRVTLSQSAETRRVRQVKSAATRCAPSAVPSTAPSLARRAHAVAQAPTAALGTSQSLRRTRHSHRAAGAASACVPLARVGVLAVTLASTAVTAQRATSGSSLAADACSCLVHCRRAPTA
jgi:hypothetical protein